MAEERMIDDDLNRNKKYKIRVNADGEEELYIDDEEEAEEVHAFDVPEFFYDDEEAAVMTPEQLAAREDAKKEEEKRRKEAFLKSLAAAREKYAAGDYEGALFAVNSALETDEKDGEANALKMLILSRNFTDYTLLDDCAAHAEKVNTYCTKEQKEQIKSHTASLNLRIEGAEDRAAVLHVQVEEGKQRRAELFRRDKKHALIFFTCAAVPFLVCLVIAISFAAVVFADRGGTNLVIALVFAALAVVFFIFAAVGANKVWSAMKKLSLNAKNSSTKLGREYDGVLEELEKLRAILSALED